MKRFRAFTLAEVLITLGVIGVISAMTLGTLIHNYKVMVAKNQFKKTYSTISNALNLSVQEFGENVKCYYASSSAIADCKDFYENYLFKNFKVAKYCNKNAFAQGCVPDYKEEDFPSVAGCGGFSAGTIKSNARVVLLADGSTIFPYHDGGNYFPIIGFDTNGFKGPNVAGVDVFSIRISKSNNSIPILAKTRGVIDNCMSNTSKKYFSNFSEIYK